MANMEHKEGPRVAPSRASFKSLFEEEKYKAARSSFTSLPGSDGSSSLRKSSSFSSLTDDDVVEREHARAERARQYMLRQIARHLGEVSSDRLVMGDSERDIEGNMCFPLQDEDAMHELLGSRVLSIHRIRTPLHAARNLSAHVDEAHHQLLALRIDVDGANLARTVARNVEPHAAAARLARQQIDGVAFTNVLFLIVDWNDDSKASMSCLSLAVEAHQLHGVRAPRDIGMLLTKQNLTVIDSEPAPNGTVTAEVLRYCAIFTRHLYSLDVFNCKAFALTVMKSVVKGRFVFVEDTKLQHIRDLAALGVVKSRKSVA